MSLLKMVCGDSTGSPASLALMTCTVQEQSAEMSTCEYKFGLWCLHREQLGSATVRVPLGHDAKGCSRNYPWGKLDGTVFFWPDPQDKQDIHAFIPPTPDVFFSSTICLHTTPPCHGMAYKPIMAASRGRTKKPWSWRFFCFFKKGLTFGFVLGLEIPKHTGPIPNSPHISVNRCPIDSSPTNWAVNFPP